jgi:membrane protease YdiL (CAAX protease family)
MQDRPIYQAAVSYLCLQRCTEPDDRALVEEKIYGEQQLQGTLCPKGLGPGGPLVLELNMTPTTGEGHKSLPASYRWISLFEVALGVFLVLGHNVFRVVPNEVLFLFALFWVSFKARDGGWRVPGLVRPSSWRRTLVLALVGTVVLQVGSELLVQPLAHQIWHQPEQTSSLLSSSMSAKKALISLGIVWTFAAFGEELGYRGYLLTRAADLGNRSQVAYVIAMACVAVLFGFGHFYKGPAGVLDSTYSGVVLGTLFLVSGRNLWSPILAHGLSDTFAVLAVYLGWAN